MIPIRPCTFQKGIQNTGIPCCPRKIREGTVYILRMLGLMKRRCHNSRKHSRLLLTIDQVRSLDNRISKYHFQRNGICRQDKCCNFPAGSRVDTFRLGCYDMTSDLLRVDTCQVHILCIVQFHGEQRIFLRCNLDRQTRFAPRYHYILSPQRNLCIRARLFCRCPEHRLHTNPHCFLCSRCYMNKIECDLNYSGNLSLRDKIRTKMWLHRSLCTQIYRSQLHKRHSCHN